MSDKQEKPNKFLAEKQVDGLEQLLLKLDAYPVEKDKFFREGFEHLPKFLIGLFKNSCAELSRSTSWDGSHKDIAKIIRSVHALRWEVDCIAYAQKHNMTLHENGMFFRKKSVERPYYEKFMSHEENPGTIRHKLILQNDVPLISENGKMMIVEAKRAWFSPYGTAYGSKAGKKQFLNPSSLNQLLKYQMAIEEGWIESASVVVSGRVLPQLWDWILMGPQKEGSLVKDVEIMWELHMPTGRSVLVTVKEGKNTFYREPENLLDEEKMFIHQFNQIKSSPDALKDLLLNRLTVMEVMQDYFKKKMEINRDPMDCEVWSVSNIEVEEIFSKALKQQSISSIMEFQPQPTPIVKKRLGYRNSP